MKSVSCTARLVCLYLVSTCLATNAAADEYSYSQLTVRDGLPSGVLCTYAEPEGFVWVGTSRGLARYDGKDIKTRFSGDGIHSVSDEAILDISADETGNIWILSAKGIARYRGDHDDFVFPTLGRDGAAVIAYSSCNTREGLLFGGKGKLYRYDYETGTFAVHVASDTLEDFSIHAIQELQDGSLLCMDYWNGLLLFNPRKNVFEPPPFPTARDNSCLFVDSRNRIWIAPYNRGLECFDSKGRRLYVCNTANSSLSNNIILSIIEREGRLWLGTDGGGINVLNPETGEIAVLQHRVGERGSLPGNSIQSLHCDAAGNVWAGRVRGGLILIRDLPIKTYTGIPASDAGLSYDAVLCLHQDQDSRDLWIGTDGGGLNCFHPDTERFTKFPSTAGMKIADITDCSDSELLLSVFSDGIYLFDKKTGGIRPLPLSGPLLDYQMRYSGAAVNFLKEETGAVILLTHPLYRLDPGRKVLTEIQHSDHIPGTVKRVVHADGQNLLYNLKSVLRLDSATDSLEVVYRCGQDTTLNCVSLARDHTLWLATNHGLGSFDLRTGRYSHHETDHFKQVWSVAADNGRVWLGTDTFLTLLANTSGKFSIFGEMEGALSNEYQAKAALVSQDGDVYLGGMNGLTRIRYRPQAGSGTSPEIILTDLFMDRRRVPGASRDGKVKMHWNNRDLSLRIFAKDKDILKARVYFFKVAGPKYDDIIKSSSPELILNNLPAGRYAIDASCTASDGTRAAWKKILSVTVMPPWYKARWFTALWVLFLLLSAGTFAVLSIKRKEEQMRQEMEAYKKRTEDEQLLLRIDNLVMLHLHDPNLDIPFLCSELYMSRTKLYNKIKQLTGKNIKEYITRLRMERAKELIGSSGQTFTEIAEQTGFTTLRYFSTAFRQYAGLTPSQYRAQCQKR